MPDHDDGSHKWSGISYLRRAAPFTDEGSRRMSRRIAFASLLLLISSAAFLVFPAVRFLLTAMLPVRALCAALAFAAMLPNAVPMDSATFSNNAPSLVRLFLRALICLLPFVSRTAPAPWSKRRPVCPVTQRHQIQEVYVYPYSQSALNSLAATTTAQPRSSRLTCSSRHCMRDLLHQLRPALYPLPHPRFFVHASSNPCQLCEPH